MPYLANEERRKTYAISMNLEFKFLLRSAVEMPHQGGRLKRNGAPRRNDLEERREVLPTAGRSPGA